MFFVTASVIGLLTLNPTICYGAGNVDVNKYNQVFNLLEIKDEIDAEDRTFLTEMSAEIKSLGELVDQLPSLSYAQFKDLRLKVWEEMDENMRQDSLTGSQLYRRVLYCLSDNAADHFENSKADSIRRVIINLTESNDSDTTNRQIWQLMGMELDPYNEYNLVTYDNVSVAITKELHTYLLHNSVNQDELGYEVLQRAIKYSLMCDVYSDKLDQIYNDLQSLTKTLFPKSNQRLKINEAYYNCCRTYWSLMEADMVRFDYTTLYKLDDDADSITEPNVRQYVYKYLIDCFNYLELPFRAKMITAKLDQARSETKNDKHSTKTDISNQVSAVLGEAIANNGSIINSAKELLDNLTNRNLPEAAIIYALNYIAYSLSFDNSTDNVLNLVELYSNYIDTSKPNIEAVLGLLNLSRVLGAIGQFRDADIYLERASVLSDKTFTNPFHKAVIEQMMGDNTKVLGNNDECLSHYINAAKLFEESQTLPDLLLTLYYRIIDVSFGMSDNRYITEEYIQKFHTLSDNSPWGEYQANQSKVRVAEIMMKYPYEKQKDALLNELKLCIEKGNTYSAVTILKYLGQWYFSQDDIDSSIYYYQKAFDYIASECIVHEDLDYIVEWLLNLWGLKGDMRERNYLIHTYIDIAKNDDARKTSLPYLTILGNALQLEITVGNHVEGAYIFENLSDAINNLNKRSNGDEIFRILALARSILPAINWLEFIYTNSPNQRSFLADSMRQTKDYTLDLANKYRLIIGEDSEYIKIMLAWIDASSALNDDYTSLKSELDSLEQIALNLNDSYIVGLIEAKRLKIAFKYNYFDDLRALKDKGYFAEFYDSKYDDKINISMLSNILSMMIVLECSSENFDGAEHIAKRRFNQVKRYISQKYGTLTEEQRIGLINNGVATPNDINTLVFINPSESLNAMAYDASLFYKNLLLEGNDYYRSTVLASNDSTVISAYQNLIRLREELELLTSQGKFEGKDFVNCKSKINELEELIYDGCPDLATMRIKRDATWKDIRKKLKDNQAAIEFISYQAEGKNYYGALILRRGFDAPEFVQLINDDDLLNFMGGGEMRERDVKRLYLHGGTRLTKNNNGHLLYNGVWRPLEKYLEGVERIYFCPVGNLSAIQFAAIEDDDHHKLCEKFDLRLLSTTAQLLDKEKKKDSRKKSAVSLIGDVAYEKGVRSEDAANRNYNWRQLSNSIDEINSVAALCDQSNVLETKEIVTGENATEQWFRTIDGVSPEVLLLSTHGFYYSAKTAGRVEFYVNKGLTTDSIENNFIPPLMRGGLVLSDGNQVWNNREIRPDEEDGILTSAEIAKMDLRNTDLVVLSACQTGLGDPTLTEGVNGLQRGFKLAGVKSVIMSLWEVNDMAGTKFMKEFFRQLSDGVDKHTAFRSTQLKLMEEFPTNPFMWAPFVLLD